MKLTTTLPSLALLALFALAPARAQVPSILNYQGRVTVGGTNLTTNAALFKFALVDSNGSTVYWRNDGSTAAGEPSSAVSVAVAQGLYSTLLGNTSLANMAAIPAAVFSNADVNLRVWFSAGGTNPFVQVAPDQRLGASGYALRAAVADNIASTNIDGNFAVTGTLTVGQLVAGTSTASGLDATASGGYRNMASGSWATVGGGYLNTASGLYATVGGGLFNTASGYIATVGGGELDLDDARVRQQLRVLQVADAVHVVEREVIAVQPRPSQRVDRELVERFRLADLDDHAFGRHRLVHAVDDQARARVQQPEPVADDVFHAPLQEHALHDTAGRGVGIVERGRLVGSAAVQQLVAEDLAFRVDDRLSPEEHL